MADTIPLLILDAVVLPGPGTEIYLDLAEAAALLAQWPDDPSSGRAIALGARPPFAAPPPGGASPPGNPGPLLAECVVGTGSLLGVGSPAEADAQDWEGDGQDDDPRLLIQGMSRAKLASVSPVGLVPASASLAPGEGLTTAPDGWRCSVEPWPLAVGARTSADVEGLERRFLRLALATADPHEPRLMEGPIRELTEASRALAKLFVMADNLFEAPSARVHALTAAGVDALADQVEDALELMEEGIAVHPKVLRGSVAAYARAATQGPVEDLARAAMTLRAVAPVAAAPAAPTAPPGAQPSQPDAQPDAQPDREALAEAIEALAQAAQEAASRAEALTRMLATAGRGPRGKRRRP